MLGINFTSQEETRAYACAYFLFTILLVSWQAYLACIIAITASEIAIILAEEIHKLAEQYVAFHEARNDNQDH